MVQVISQSVILCLLTSGVFDNHPKVIEATSSKSSGVIEFLEQYGMPGVKGLAKKAHLFRADNKERFLGEDPVNAFLNAAGVVSDIFTYWGFIESQVKNIQEKKKREDDEDKEDCSSGIENLQSKIDDLSKGMKQVTCRLDAVHLKSSDYDRECLQYIRPYQANTRTAINTKPKSSYSKTSNKHTLLTL